jgi:hypothetical protein
MVKGAVELSGVNTVSGTGSIPKYLGFKDLATAKVTYVRRKLQKKYEGYQ